MFDILDQISKIFFICTKKGFHQFSKKSAFFYLLFIFFFSFIQKINATYKDSLWQIVFQNKKDTIHSRALVLLAEYYQNTNIDTAEKLAKDAIQITTQEQQYKIQAYANNCMGYIQYIKGDYKASIESFVQYYESAKKTNDLKAMAFAKNNEGNVYIELGDYIKAIEKYNDALALRLKINDSNSIAMSYNNFGFIYKDVGDYEKAISNFFNALRIYEKMQDKNSIASTYNYIGQVYKKQKEITKAKEYFNKSLDIYKLIGDRQGEGLIYHSIGSLLCEESKPDSAKFYFNYALSLYEIVNDLRQKSILYTDIANMFTENKLIDSSLKYYLLALQENNTIGNKRNASAIYNGLANIYISKKNFVEAKKYLDLSIQVLLQTNKKEDYKEYYFALSKYNRGIGKADLALQNMELYNLYKDSLINEQNKKAIADIQIKYDVSKKDQEILLQKAIINKRNIFLFSSVLVSLLILITGIALFKRQKAIQKNKMQEALLLQQDIATKAVLEAEENERKRIGSDLHDGVGQLMTAARMNLEAIKERIQFTSTQDKEAYYKTKALIDESCKEVRAVSHNIMPNALLKSGLSNAVKEFLNNLDNRVLQINLHTLGLNERIDTNIETVLYRVIQECVHNIIKHAQATTVDISLIKDGDGISVTIEDNGIGFDKNVLEKKDGIGIKNIKTRIAYLKGNIDIDTHPGNGTLIAIHVPI